MRKYYLIIIFVSLGLVIGTLFAPLINIGRLGFYLFIIFILLSFLFIRFNYFRLILLFISFLFLALWRYHLWLPGDLAQYNGKKVELTGFICEESDRRGESQKVLLCTSGGKILINTSLYPEYYYGDQVSFKGTLKAPEAIEDFRYDYYLARYGIYSLSYQPTLKKIGEGRSLNNLFFRSLFNIKKKLFGIINQGLPEPEAGLGSALILGYKRTVSDANLDLFSIIGISHMIAISGTHITMISAMVMKLLLLFRFRKKRAFYLAIVFLFLYVLLTGWQASAVRSLIMGGMALWAACFGRDVRIEVLLVFSAGIMLLFNPTLLRDDLGFQLSFLAMLALVYIYPIGDYLGQRFLGKRKRLKLVWDVLNVTIAAQLVTMPISLINFNRFSIIAPVANIIVLWTFPFLMGALAGALFLSGFIPILGWFWFWPAYCLLRYQFIMTNILAKVPGAALENQSWNWAWGWTYYFILSVLVILLYRRLVIMTYSPHSKRPS
ncbi:MAG: ComEC/Rec2 family competence protein [Patescibacteria group bacterium]